MFIIEGSSNSQHYQCEGSHCDKATEAYIEGREEDDVEETAEMTQADLEELKGLMDDILNK